MPSVSRSSSKAVIHCAVSSSSEWPFATAFLMIRSSTSVRFITWVTLFPNLRSSQRRRTSSKMNVRKLPMWTRFQTVGPHVYIRMCPGSIGSTATSSRLIVSCSWSVTAVPATPSPQRRSLRSERRGQPGLLGNRDDVGTGDNPALGLELLGHHVQELAAGGVLPLGVTGRKVLAHVAEPGGAEYCVD